MPEPRIRPASFEPIRHRLYKERPLCWDYQSIINYILNLPATLQSAFNRLGFSRALGNLTFESRGRPSKIIMRIICFLNLIEVS
jgi:hypothetical protein